MVSASIDIIVGEFFVVSAVSAYLLWYYQSPLVSFDITVTVYIAWVLGFSGILLLPYDLSLALMDDFESQRLWTIWTFIYWSTFCLAWLVLPIQMEFHSSGYFTTYEKVKSDIERVS